MKRKTAPPKNTQQPAKLAGAQPDAAMVNGVLDLVNTRQYPQAEAVARAMVAHFPRFAFGWKVLGGVLQLAGRADEALAPMQKAAGLEPGDAGTHSNLASTLHLLGRLAEAEASARRALAIDPRMVEAHNNLGIVQIAQGRLAEAEASCLRALALRPGYAEALNNLGIAQKDQGRVQEAEANYRRALERNPGYADAHNNLGNALKAQNRLTEAGDCFRRALELHPGYVDAHNNLGNLLGEQGLLNAAEASFRRALQLRPGFTEACSNLLFTLNYSTTHSAARCLDEARAYGRMVQAQACPPYSAWRCAPQPKRLRVGLVSGDLREHAVGHFLEGWLARHDPERLELFAYPTHPVEDTLSARVRPRFAAWKPLLGLSDRAAAAMVHSDGVHVLLDLSGHTAYNRLPLFGWKPAPVQAAWLGYFASTGLPQMDYVLVDPWCAPPAVDADFTEKLWRLPETRLCFTPPREAPEVAPLPAAANGFITFGCFNNLCKLNPEVVAVWAKVLGALPSSRLVLRAKQLGDPQLRQNVAAAFAAHGIEGGRLSLFGPVPRADYLACYGGVDIVLDPFPFPGGTTSAEALWMGVPVLTLSGDRFLGRQGVGLLMNVGLPDWVATDTGDYVARALAHAGDLDRLSALRAGLRAQALGSPLFDAQRFSRHLEAALWEMWRASGDGAVVME